ncbi:Hsp70 family protein [Tianweitania sediminis]|uniref:Hsp70 family protein n=1 Tax=Tianweitania sediminis TaxID=1502156 RepID=A0A8J7RMI4_9HYPH|nr:Hsp70 family protein [Tianweitania sediminis]MBP0441101.1 Hsp70 family protein [Tianweitania sediminis]
MKPITGGIDFGTSNSTVGIVENGQPSLVPLEGEHPTIPTAVFFNFETNRTEFGRHAIANYTDNVEGRLLRALKSVLGTSLIGEKTRVKAQSIAFTDIIGAFLQHLKSALDEKRGGDVEHVVLGRPVHFVDDDPAADAKAQGELEQAARKRGFKHIAFQFEPIAAALDYERTVTREELALIVDIGGGTSDFSIVRVSPDRAKQADRRGDILANTGVHVGGTDLDRLISVAHVMPELGYNTLTKDGRRNLPVGTYFDLATWQRINLLYTAKAMNTLRQIRYEAAEPHKVERLIDVVENRQGHALAAKVETAKIELTDAEQTELDMRLMAEVLRVTVTRPGLEKAITPPVGRITDTITRTLADAGLTPDRIDTLFLTGGSTAVPLLRESVLRLFPNARAVQGDRFGSVGLGLALDAERKFAA